MDKSMSDKNPNHRPLVTLNSFPLCSFCIQLYNDFQSKKLRGEDLMKILDELKSQLSFHGIEEEPFLFMTNLERQEWMRMSSSNNGVKN